MKYGMDEKLMINLIDYLWGYAEKHGIRCIWLDGSPDEEPYSRITKYNTKEILVNINWKHANLLNKLPLKTRDFNPVMKTALFIVFF
ncbi:hypothetical protein [Lactobacillus johnsonii]